jgi:peptide/nickel transport system substrate-binding protein
MDWKRFDRARENVTPVELDLIEHYAQGKIRRRDFLKRGTIIGLSMPFMGAIIAACGGDDDDATPSATDPPGGTTGESTGETTGESTGTTAPPAAAAGGSIIIAIQQGDAGTGLDPVNMIDLGTYNVIAQSFEFLVGLGDDGNIAPTALATGWTPNDTGDVWTFDLRPGVTWQNGSEFTSADVAATMDRLAAQGNAGLAGVIAEGSVDASDPTKAVFTLVEANGNFPVLVSLFNAQAVITPADYTDGTTLSERPDGTGAWKLDSFDASTFVARFSRNPDWWGGQTVLDSIELRGFADMSTSVTAMQARDIDVIQQFTVLAGDSLLNDANFTLLTPPASTHREVWFNTQQSQFSSLPLRQAIAWAVDREQMVETLFAGRAEVGNDHPVLSALPFYDPDAVPQRVRDVEMARQLLSDASLDGVSTGLASGDILEIPQLAAIIQQNLSEVGISVEVNTQSNSTFYGDAWCPGADPADPTLPCSNSADFGIVDYGHRPTPDVFLGSALSTGGVWNSSNWTNPDFDAKLSEYRRATDVDGQKAAIGAIQKILWDEVPIVMPYFYNYLCGHDNSVTGVQATALGHTIVSQASKA